MLLLVSLLFVAVINPYYLFKFNFLFKHQFYFLWPTLLLNNITSQLLNCKKILYYLTVQPCNYVLIAATQLLLYRSKFIMYRQSNIYSCIIYSQQWQTTILRCVWCSFLKSTWMALNWLLRTEYLILEVNLEVQCSQCGLPQKVFYQSVFSYL